MKILHRYVESTDIKIFLKRVLFFSALLHLIAAIFSTGFHHWDEHYQIYEFLGAKLGVSKYSDLTWEYPHMMRSWIQPGMYYAVAKPLSWIGLNNPFSLALVFRLITSAIGLISLFYLNLATLKWIREFKYSKWAILLTHFLWFIPFIQARTSSETMSGSLFVLAISLIVINENKEKFLSSLWIGILMGLSFQFRFQLGFLVMFVWFWQLFIGKNKISSLSIQALGIILCFGLEVLIAKWGYGKWTFTPWNYVYENLVLNKQAGWGGMPWYDYFRLTLARGIPPISIFLVFGTTFFWMMHPKHLLTWATLPLLIVHSAISAKALRYMFPIATLTPVMMVLFYVKLQSMNIPLKEMTRKKSFKKFIKFTWGINLIVLLVVSFKSANPMVNLLSYLYSNQEKYESVLVYGSNPFKPITNPTAYYTHPNLEHIQIAEFEDLLKDNRSKFKIVDRAKWARIAITDGCQLHYSSIPKFILTSSLFKPFERTRVWSLLECHQK
ncbi:MAG: hypothetical protein KC478_16405 [Bacteriovoracaceae bacterium]|nr:hypothetical protein [Bacteriovoracaceae bacterium]